MSPYQQPLLKIILLSFAPIATGVTGLGEMVIGDIQLIPDAIHDGYYQPLVYFTNGIEPLQLGGICYDNIGKIQATVICNQLGYQLADYTGALKSADNSHPIWFGDVNCEDKQLQHILSCNYNITFGYSTRQWPCKTNYYLILKCDWNKPLTIGTYDGYISLCPPDNSNITRSNSFGLVAIYLSQHDIWRGLNQPNNSNPLGVIEANAICQQLGYAMAVPGSAVTSRAVQTQYTFEHCYDTDPPYRVQKQAWMPTNAVQCSGPQTCFSCCYDYPATPKCDHCNRFNDLVLQCTFVPDQAKRSSGKGGAENECAYNNAVCKSNSCTGHHDTDTASICAGIAVPLGSLAIIVAISISSCVTYCVGKRRRIPPPQDEGQGQGGERQHLINQPRQNGNN